MTSRDFRHVSRRERRAPGREGRHGRVRRLLFVAVAVVFVTGAAASACQPGGRVEAEPATTRGSGLPAAPADSPGTSARDVPVRVSFETSRGTFVIAVHREWAPRGADRFLFLVESGYFDDARFHRVVPGFIAQWGLAGDPALTAEWLNAFMPDDPVLVSNTRGRIAYAFTEPGTRSTQVYINLIDNVRLDSAGFAPFAEVATGMDVVDALYSGYGEDSGGGVRRGDQSRIVADGNLYLDREFPLLDRIESVRVVQDRESGPEPTGG